MKRSALYTLALLLITLSANAQYIQVDNTYTAQELVDALMANSCTQVSNATVNGAPSSVASYGYFNAGSSTFPFTGGVVLTSGFANSAPGPNLTTLSEGLNNWGGDNDLENAINTTATKNATVLEFDFIPLTNNISFDYIFTSEEYLQNAPEGWCNYSDGFAFLIRPVGSSAPYENLAVIPGTNTPIKVTSVRGPGSCPTANAEYFGSYNTVASPINFNGQTVALTAATTVVAGTAYHIKLVIADQDDTQFDSAIFLGEGSFNAGTDIGEDRLLTAGNPLCAGETLVLDGTVSNAVSYQWFKNNAAIAGAVNAQYTVNTAGDYRVEITLAGGCSSSGTITIEYAPVPNTATIRAYQCDDDSDGITDYYFSQISAQVAARPDNYTVLSYHTTQPDAAADVNPILLATPDAPYRNLTPGQLIYARAQNTYGCAFTIPVVLDVPVPVTATWGIVGRCDSTDGADDGFVQFNLNDIAAGMQAAYPTTASVKFYASYDEALKLGATLPLQYTNTIALAETIYARLDDAAGCNTVVAVPLRVYSFGDALAPQEDFVCDGHTLTFDAGTGYAAYSWNTTPVQTTQTLTVTQGGTYTVTLTTNEGCVGTKTFTAVRSGAATGATYQINDFRGSSNSVTIMAEGSGRYHYSLDGQTYQESPEFVNLPSGLYTYYIMDVNGCSPVYSKSFYILDYPKFFTPNSDGYKDTWRIPYMSTRPTIAVTIFDRFGQLITGFTGASSGWDGTLNGHPLPAGDYWFAINLENGEVVKGHFSLIR
ncbi:choice-of-anchor L domain-containing protein [Flavobacterium sp. RHBU_24]|uniref:choice-of-anchor L domain-containing protein n=1 Tax=Flavobacterium sp. RHBU_24 TaxID=3391185 RepID=UPI003984CFB9